MAVISSHFTDTHAKGESLSDRERLHRVNTLRCLLRSGVPLNKLNGPLRELASQGAFAIPNANCLRQLLPVVLTEELQFIKEELAGQNVTVIFDGTTTEDEVLAVVCR
jgi:hypothetical protein